MTWKRYTAEDIIRHLRMIGIEMGKGGRYRGVSQLGVDLPPKTTPFAAFSEPDQPFTADKRKVHKNRLNGLTLSTNG